MPAATAPGGLVALETLEGGEALADHLVLFDSYIHALQAGRSVNCSPESNHPVL